jgi:DNA-binding NtrC family response regulator
MIMARPLEIVVVDDEQQITDLLTMAIQFTSKTAQVHAFNDASVAREYLLAHVVDLVITDYKMPHYDGIELLEIVPDETRKVLISGYVSEVAEEKLAEMDALFFEKPVPIKTLGKLISEQELRAAGHPA